MPRSFVDWFYQSVAKTNGQYISLEDLDTGLEPCRKIANLAETHHLPLAPHDCTGSVPLITTCETA